MSNPESAYLQGPFDLDPETIDTHVEKNRPGTYSLVRVCKDGNIVFFNTDESSDLNQAIKDKIGNIGEYKHFMFAYSPEPVCT